MLEPAVNRHERSAALRRGMSTTADAARLERAASPDVVVDENALSLPRRMVRNMAVQDWFVLGYFLVLIAAVIGGSGPNRAGNLRTLLHDTAIITVALVLVRGELLKGVAAATLYRLGLIVSILLSYFQLRWILPAVTSRAVDAQIFAFDMRVFGVEPSVAWDKFVAPATTEWFAFFYFGYFAIMAAHIVPFVTLSKDSRLLRHFGIGLVAQFCITHVLYLVVPGYGPYHELHFQHELQGGVFWRLVQESVHSAGALKDIFPSLHTGAPTFIAIFSFVHRKHAPFKYTWPVIAFCALQIIGATMFLRWHYLIDIIAGFSLAAVNVYVGGKVVRWEEGRRARAGSMPLFGEAPLPWLVKRVMAGKAD